MKPQALTAIREAEHQSRSAFALRLGISRNSLAAYESGKARIPKYVMLAVTCIRDHKPEKEGKP